MSLLDFVLVGLILAALILAIRAVIRAKKQGKTCDGNCGGCSGCSQKQK